SRTARSSAATEPTHLLRDRDSFLPWPSAGTHRRHVRPSSIVHALANTSAGHDARPNTLAQAAWPPLDRKVARRARPLRRPLGAVVAKRRMLLTSPCYGPSQVRY